MGRGLHDWTTMACATVGHSPWQSLIVPVFWQVLVVFWDETLGGQVRHPLVGNQEPLCATWLHINI